MQNDTTTPKFLSLPTFEKYLDYLDRSHIDQVRLLGGEPTLHPDFPQLLKMSIQRGKNILLFTNGLMPTKALEAILDVPLNRIKVLVNITQTSVQSTKVINERQYKVLQELGERSFLGYTLFDLNPDYLFPIIDIVQSSKCSPAIRLGVSQPTAYGNVSLSPKHYRRVGKIVTKFIQKAHQSNVQIELDCGFVRCMFSDRDISEMKQMNVIFGWHCNPLIDIVIDESAFPCFPLSREFIIENALDSSENELMSLFIEKTKLFRVVGVFAECSSCSYRISEGCSGGCLSAALQRIHKKPFSYTFPKEY